MAEATLGFRQVAVRDAGDEPVEEDAGPGFFFICDKKQRDGLVIFLV